MTVSFVHVGEEKSVVLATDAEINLWSVLRPYDVELEWIDERRLGIEWKNAWKEPEALDIFVRVGSIAHVIEAPSGETRAVFEHPVGPGWHVLVEVAARGTAGSTQRSLGVRTQLWIYPPTLSASSDSYDRTLRLSWTPSEDGAAPAGYRLERRLEDGSVETWEFGAETTTLVDQLPGTVEEVEYRIGTLASSKQSVRFGRIAPYLERAEFSAGTSPVVDLAFGADGHVYTASDVVTRYDPIADRADELLPALFYGYEAVAISPDGSTYAASSVGGDVIVREVSTGNEVWRTRRLRSYRLLFSPDSRHLFVVPSIDQVIQYDARTGEFIKRIGSTTNEWHFGRRQVALSPDGTTLFVGASTGGGWQLEKWRVHDGVHLQSSLASTNIPSSASASPSGEYVVAGSAESDGTSVIYRAGDLSRVGVVQLGSPRFSRNGDDSVFGMDGTRMISYDVAAGRINGLANLSAEPYSIATSSDGSLVAIGFVNGHVKVLERSHEKVWMLSPWWTSSW